MSTKFASRSIASFIVTVGLLLSVGCEGRASLESAKLRRPIDVEEQASASVGQRQQALGHFYRDLSRLQNGQLTQVNILQLGDSHTAADFFSGRLREQFQKQFGDGGRGMMPPGYAFQGIDQRHMKFFQNNQWTIENSLKSPASGPYGISGFLARSMGAGAHMTLTANALDDGFDRASVDYLEHPGGGKLQVLVDGETVANVSTSGPDGQLGHYVVRNHGRMATFEIIAHAPNIEITAWSVSRNDSGIVFSSHGVVGATVDLVNRWDPRLVASDIAELHPSLIIIAYGTNEAFDSDFKATQYAQNFAHVLATIKQDAPYASVVVVGPPDSQRADPGCASHTSNSDCNWGRPPALDNVRTLERESARTAGAAFWDWAAVMPEGITAWIDRGMARSDHVHFTQIGYEAAADQLYEWLIAGYVPSRGPGPYGEKP